MKLSSLSFVCRVTGVEEQGKEREILKQKLPASLYLNVPAAIGGRSALLRFVCGFQVSLGENETGPTTKHELIRPELMLSYIGELWGEGDRA